MGRVHPWNIRAKMDERRAKDRADAAARPTVAVACWTSPAPVRAHHAGPWPRQAESDVSKLAVVLEAERGMTVADVGAGGGAMTVVMARRLGSTGRVYATDIAPAQLVELRELVSRERLENVVVLEGAEHSTNLPTACCDAIFLRDVYHHLTHPSRGMTFLPA